MDVRSGPDPPPPPPLLLVLSFGWCRVGRRQILPQMHLHQRTRRKFSSAKGPGKSIPDYLWGGGGQHTNYWAPRTRKRHQQEHRHQVGGVSRSPDGLFAQQEREPIRGRPAVRGKRTYGGRPGQRVEELGTWASCTQKHSEAGYRRPVDRGAWTAKTVKRPRQQPAHPQYANYWAPLTRKRHIPPHSAQPQHTNHWAPRTRK